MEGVGSVTRQVHHHHWFGGEDSAYWEDSVHLYNSGHHHWQEGRGGHIISLNRFTCEVIKIHLDCFSGHVPHTTQVKNLGNPHEASVRARGRHYNKEPSINKILPTSPKTQFHTQTSINTQYLKILPTHPKRLIHPVLHHTKWATQ